MKLQSLKKLPEVKNQFYNFWRDGVTQSMIQSWLTCARQCYYEYVIGLEEYTHKDPYLFGNICHYVLQHAYISEQQVLPGNVLSLVTQYKEKIQTNDLPMAAYEHNEWIFAKAEAVMLSYFIYYKDDWKQKVDLTEYKFRIPFKFHDGRMTFLNGMIDHLSSPISNQFVLMDHKTLSRINVDSFLDSLPFDLQLNFYLFVCWKLKNAGKLKLFPTHFRYNIIRNPQSKPHKNETPDQYTQRLQLKILEDPKHYFYRIKCAVDLGETLNWAKTQLIPIMYDMRSWVQSNYNWRGYYNPKALVNESGNLRPMAKAVMGDLAGYRQKAHPFMELQ